MGVNQTRYLRLKDQNLDSVPVVELSSIIESVIKKWNPTIVYTHFWGDVNQDHRKVYEAALIGIRMKSSRFHIPDLKRP